MIVSRGRICSDRLTRNLEGASGLWARSTGYSSGKGTSHAYYPSDGNGNITCLIDGSQSVGASYRYDPYGNTLAKSGTLADANVYRFSSRWGIALAERSPGQRFAPQPATRRGLSTVSIRRVYGE